ncbi:hypothetical protein V2J09_009028 [Rumex salicifolius]
MKLIKGSMVIAKGSLNYILQKIQMKVLRDGMNAIQDDTSPDLWLRCLAHMSEKGLKILAKKSLIPSVKDSCHGGKRERCSLKFLHSDNRGNDTSEESSLGISTKEIHASNDVLPGAETGEDFEQKELEENEEANELRKSTRDPHPSTRYLSS